MKSIFGVFITVLLLACLRGCHSNEEHEEVTDSTQNGCQGTILDVKAAVRASHGSMTDVLVNCLAYSDANTIESGIVSWRTESEEGRYVVGCYGGLLLLSESQFNEYTENITSCTSCADTEELTCNDQECYDLCRQCYGPQPSQCVLCSYAEYNGLCEESCPGNTTANDELNVCVCPTYFEGVNCSVCGLISGDCPSTYYINRTSCDCEECQEGFQTLVDPYSTVPASVIGSPEGAESEGGNEGHESTGGGEEEQEPTECVEKCPFGWEMDDRSAICYACGITYCLECTSSNNECTTCRNGTLPFKGDCGGFYTVIAELAHELEEEVEHEREVLDEEKLHLKIALPIVCFFVAVFFIAFAVFAHFRYPHVGHQKRHRKPNRSTTVTETEKSFRPQSTVRFR